MDTRPKIDLRALACKVVAFLPGWKLTAPRHEASDDNHAILVRAEGGEIWISGNSWTRDGRLCISGGGWPLTKKGEKCEPYRHSGSEDPSSRITVAEGRPAKEIAREIERRVLPVYLATYAKMVERRNTIDARQDSTKTASKDLAEIVGGEVRGEERGDGEVHWYFEDATYGDAKSSDGGKEWTLNVHNLPYEKLARILKIVKG